MGAAGNRYRKTELKRFRKVSNSGTAYKCRNKILYNMTDFSVNFH